MNEDKVIQKLFEHDDQFAQVREEVGDLRREVLHNLDGMMVILKRLDEERIFTYEMVKRIEGRVDAHDQEIQKTKQEVLKLKTRLNVA